MKVAIICNSSLMEEKEYIYQPNRLKEEFATYDIDVDILGNTECKIYIEAGQIQCEFARYSFIIFLDKDKYLLEMLDKMKMPIFNCKDAILTCDDKMLTYIALANYGIAMPKTRAGALLFKNKEEMMTREIFIIEKDFKYPILLKECYGSGGKNVYLIENRENLQSMLDRVLCKPYLLQEYVPESAGMDIRVIVIGGKVIGAIERRNTKDFRSNIEQGGQGYTYLVDSVLKELAEKVATLLRLDYCGIDFLKGKNGYLLCEVNSNAFFYSFEKVTEINVAKVYVEYLLKKLQL